MSFRERTYKMDEITIDSAYYDDIQTIARLVIDRYKSVGSLRNPYAEAANMLKGVKHRNEQAFSNDAKNEVHLNNSELWALNAAIDDLSKEPHPDMSVKTLRLLSNYLSQFNK